MGLRSRREEVGVSRDSLVKMSALNEYNAFGL
jgi:hypothetical protein